MPRPWAAAAVKLVKLRPAGVTLVKSWRVIQSSAVPPAPSTRPRRKVAVTCCTATLVAAVT